MKRFKISRHSRKVEKKGWWLMRQSEVRELVHSDCWRFRRRCLSSGDSSEGRAASGVGAVACLEPSLPSSVMTAAAGGAGEAGLLCLLRRVELVEELRFSTGR